MALCIHCIWSCLDFELLFCNVLSSNNTKLLNFFNFHEWYAYDREISSVQIIRNPAHVCISGIQLNSKRSGSMYLPVYDILDYDILDYVIVETDCSNISNKKIVISLGVMFTKM